MAMIKRFNMVCAQHRIELTSSGQQVDRVHVGERAEHEEKNHSHDVFDRSPSGRE